MTVCDNGTCFGTVRYLVSKPLSVSLADMPSHIGLDVAHLINKTTLKFTSAFHI